jgi:hypothetical protein
VKQQHTSTATSILTTKSTYRSLSAQRLSKRTLYLSWSTANETTTNIITIYSKKLNLDVSTSLPRQRGPKPGLQLICRQSLLIYNITLYNNNIYVTNIKCSKAVSVAPVVLSGYRSVERTEIILCYIKPCTVSERWYPMGKMRIPISVFLIPMWYLAREVVPTVLTWLLYICIINSMNNFNYVLHIYNYVVNQQLHTDTVWFIIQ